MQHIVSDVQRILLLCFLGRSKNCNNRKKAWSDFIFFILAYFLLEYKSTNTLRYYEAEFDYVRIFIFVVSFRFHWPHWPFFVSSSSLSLSFSLHLSLTTSTRALPRPSIYSAFPNFSISIYNFFFCYFIGSARISQTRINLCESDKENEIHIKIWRARSWLYISICMRFNQSYWNKQHREYSFSVRFDISEAVADSQILCIYTQIFVHLYVRACVCVCMFVRHMF